MNGAIVAALPVAVERAWPHIRRAVYAAREVCASVAGPKTGVLAARQFAFALSGTGHRTVELALAYLDRHPDVADRATAAAVSEELLSLHVTGRIER